MRNPNLLIFIFFLTTITFACNREKVNLEGRWEIAQVSGPKADVAKDSVSHLLLHWSVGNKLDFTAGELIANRKGANDSTYYGLASYKVAKDGKTVVIDAGSYKPLKFELRNADDDQVELTYKRQEVKVVLKPYEAPEE
ncbi:hypothetical protein [Adhaeribacter terreus]|uniref:Lipocalin-like domain-containing protein n=1 Tax=Adhaeribacter terreus TaxID=529703 RepID=A0ABW0EEA0_9BACT